MQYDIEYGIAFLFGSIAFRAKTWMTKTFQEILKLASDRGLVYRGGFNVTETDEVPEINNGVPGSTLLMFGNAGSSLWEVFCASREYSDGKPDPLNRWSERVGTDIAIQVSGTVLFPFGGPPYQPFLQWAKKAESLQHSKLGMLIHPQYGLWHAYRFAIALPYVLDNLEQSKNEIENICVDCVTKPCLTTCPVNAFSDSGYDVSSCYEYLKDNSDSACRTRTCQARLACPEGHKFVYNVDHGRFHMNAFIISMESKFKSNSH